VGLFRKKNKKKKNTCAYCEEPSVCECEMCGKKVCLRHAKYVEDNNSDAILCVWCLDDVWEML
jgi:hypothetical protein